IMANELEKEENFSKETYSALLILLSPFAPHIAEELWSNLGNKNSICLENWPECDESKLISDETNIVVQINGKVRASFITSKDKGQKEIEGIALSIPEVKKWTDGKEIKKIFFIKGKVVSIVV
ncbi:MAG: class I tRNA ligase family protein, partial [Patescibacteria group bacterium]